jgi:hypothetical protein
VLVVAPLLFWFIGREGHVRTIDLYSAMFPAGLAAASVLTALFVFRRLVMNIRPGNGIVIGFVLSSLAALLVLLIFPRGRSALMDFKRSVTLLFKKSDQAAEAIEPST